MMVPEGAGVVHVRHCPSHASPLELAVQIRKSISNLFFSNDDRGYLALC